MTVRILVVDEESMIHDVVAAALEAEDYVIEGFHSPALALAAVEEPVDLILLHRGLPETDCHRLISQARRFGDPALVLLSSQKNFESERNKLRMGAGEFVYKPIDPLALRAVVHRQLARPAVDFEVPVGPRLLVVDDDILVRSSVQDILEDYGYEAESVASAKEALEVLELRPFEIILTDVMMEGISGLELVSHMSSVRPHALALVMTGFASKDLAISAVRAGAYDVLEKPLTPDLVVRAVERAWNLLRYRLDNHRLLIELRRMNRDLKEAKRVVEVASRAKSEFLANMSHEIRTPLNGVLGGLSLLGQSPLEKQQQKHLKVARNAGESLLGMLTDILDFAAMDTDIAQPVLQLADVNLRDLMENVVAGSRPQVEASGLSLTLTIDEAVPEAVHVDGHRLSRVLSNLLDNASKFTRRGGIEVGLSMHDDRLRMSIQDTGQGIDSVALEQIFQPFFQADSSTTREVGGTGLGLALCRRLVQAMDGTIELESEAGKGSRFVVSLPVVAPKEPGGGIVQAADNGRVGPLPTSTAADAPTAASPADTPNAAGDEAGTSAEDGPRRVLLADDDATNAFLLEEMLKQLGYDVTRVENGQQAVDAYQEQPHEVVLLDYQMPLLDGPAAAQRIRRLEAEHAWRRSVIVAVTGFSLAEYEAQCRAAGMDHFLTKPIRLATLRQSSETWLP